MVQLNGRWIFISPLGATLSFTDIYEWFCFRDCWVSRAGHGCRLKLASTLWENPILRRIARAQDKKDNVFDMCALGPSAKSNKTKPTITTSDMNIIKETMVKNIPKEKKTFLNSPFIHRSSFVISNGIFKYFIHKCEFIVCVVNVIQNHRAEPRFHGSCNILYTYLLNVTCKQKERTETKKKTTRKSFGPYATQSYSHTHGMWTFSFTVRLPFVCQWHMYLAFYNMNASSCRQLHTTNHR